MEKTAKNKLEILSVAAFILAAAFIILLKSPLNFWIRADAETDSSVYKTVAFMMSKGYMPYRDSFDHKGPLTYLVNLLGMQIDGYCGVWVVEFAAISATFAGIYKIARLCCNRVFSCVCVLISGSLLYDYFEGGNMVEEYAMPFIAFSLYIFLDYFINRKISRLRLAVCGACLGAVFLLRPNMISVWVVFAVAVLIDCICRHNAAGLKGFKEFKFFLPESSNHDKNIALKELGNFMIFFMLGFIAVITPIFIWLAVNGCFGAFIEDYIQFNMVYSSAKGQGDKWNAGFYFANKTLIIFALLICAYLCSIKDRFLYGVYLAYLFITLLFISMSGMPYAHYGMILVPALAFPMASLFALAHSEPNAKSLTLFITLYILGALALPKWFGAAGDMVNKYADRAADHHSDMVKGVCELIEENTTENERISVYGNGDIVYLISNRLHATGYSYQFPIGEIAPDIMDEYFEEMEEELPPIVVIWQRQADERIENFLSEHNYTEISDRQPYDIGSTRVFLIAE